MLGRFAPGIRRAGGPGQVTGDVRKRYPSRFAPKYALGFRFPGGRISS